MKNKRREKITTRPKPNTNANLVDFPSNVCTYVEVETKIELRAFSVLSLSLRRFSNAWTKCANVWEKTKTCNSKAIAASSNCVDWFASIRRKKWEKRDFEFSLRQNFVSGQTRFRQSLQKSRKTSIREFVVDAGALSRVHSTSTSIRL